MVELQLMIIAENAIVTQLTTTFQIVQVNGVEKHLRMTVAYVLVEFLGTMQIVI